MKQDPQRRGTCGVATGRRGLHSLVDSPSAVAPIYGRAQPDFRWTCRHYRLINQHFRRDVLHAVALLPALVEAESGAAITCGLPVRPRHPVRSELFRNRNVWAG
jgi:hypothetical protein